MPLIFIYLVKVFLSLGIVYLFYRLLLRKLTFYNWNRWYLLGYTLLSFFISFINISPFLERNAWTASKVVQWVPVIQTPGTNRTAETVSGNATGSLSAWNILGILLITGMLIMLFRLLFQLYSFLRMKRKARLIPGGGMRMYQVNELIIPFSFGNSIFINRQLHAGEELEEIIRHEFVHVKQKHTADIIWGELLCLLNWYNPFAWLLKAAIRQNLEFIADNKVVANGVNKKQYQYLLLKVIGNNQFSIAPKFNFSSLKKRIAMMNKMKSARVHIVKFLFILPLIAVILVAFRTKNDDRSRIKSLFPSGKPAIKTDGKDGIFFRDTIPDEMTPNDKGYYIDIIGDIKMSKVVMKDKNNKEYSNYVIDNKDKCTVVVSDKNRKEVARMSLTEWNKKEKYYTDLYGEILLPPPPPDTPTVTVTPPPPPPPTVTPPPTPKAKDGEGSLSGISDEYEITDKRATLKLKNGTVEKYDLTNREQRSAFEKKYGKIITARTNTSVSLATVAVVSKGANTVVTPVAATSNNAVEAVISSKTIAEAITPNTVITPLAAISNSSGKTVIAPMTPTAGEGVTIVDDYGYTITGKEDILVTITKSTTRQELEGFKKQMKEKGIELNFDEVEYNDKGILTTITGTMKSQDGQSNFSASDFKKLILATIKSRNHTYFKVSVMDNKKVVI